MTQCVARCDNNYDDDDEWDECWDACWERYVYNQGHAGQVRATLLHYPSEIESCMRRGYVYAYEITKA
jgi:hypothetical protein